MLDRRTALAALGVSGAAALTAGCSTDRGEGESADGGSGGGGAGGFGGSGETLRISAIPDSDPELLTEREEALASYLAGALGLEVEYVPVPDYAASVTLFGAGDLDLVFYGALTGVQARLQNPEAVIVAQRDIDQKFTSVFIAHASAGIEPAGAVEGLSVFAGTRFTFGSQTSTSGRLMPSHFLAEAGVSEDDLDGEPGFSGSHDTTIELVQSGSYQAGAVSSEVWDSRTAAGEVDTNAVVEVLVTPEYSNYHWLFTADADGRFGDGFTQALTELMHGMHEDGEQAQEILEAYSAGALVPAEPADYEGIEAVATELGLLG